MTSLRFFCLTPKEFCLEPFTAYEVDLLILWSFSKRVLRGLPQKIRKWFYQETSTTISRFPNLQLLIVSDWKICWRILIYYNSLHPLPPDNPTRITKDHFHSARSLCLFSIFNISTATTVPSAFSDHNMIMITEGKLMDGKLMVCARNQGCDSRMEREDFWGKFIHYSSHFPFLKLRNNKIGTLIRLSAY